MKERTPVNNPGMYAIKTTYHGPTDTSGSTITAEILNGGLQPEDRVRVVQGYDHALDAPHNHASAAVALVNARKSAGAWAESISLVQGATSDGYVFVPTWGEVE